jgi:hypothetical protein
MGARRKVKEWEIEKGWVQREWNELWKLQRGGRDVETQRAYGVEQLCSKVERREMTV